VEVEYKGKQGNVILTTVERLGGKVISPKMPVPGMDYMAVCADTENNGFGIFEADQTAK